MNDYMNGEMNRWIDEKEPFVDYHKFHEVLVFHSQIVLSWLLKFFSILQKLNKQINYKQQTKYCPVHERFC